MFTVCFDDIELELEAWSWNFESWGIVRASNLVLLIVHEMKDKKGVFEDGNNLYEKSHPLVWTRQHNEGPGQGSGQGTQNLMGAEERSN